MTDLVLTILHHFAVFALAAVLVAEAAILRPGITGDRLRQLGRLDAGYGALAAIVIIVGVLRVNFGAAGADYYTHNWMFWLKITAFVAVGLLSLPPTVAILNWRRRVIADPTFVPEAEAVTHLRRFLFAEIVAFAFVLVFAAAMARGYGA